MVGDSATYPCEAAGELFLGPNDSGVDNNHGAVDGDRHPVRLSGQGDADDADDADDDGPGAAPAHRGRSHA